MSQTKQRNLVLKVISNSCSHPTAEEVYNLCREEMPNISLGTVYRNLKVLKEEGLIDVFQTDDHMKRYDKVENKQKHSHLLCVNCNEIFDIFIDLNLKDVLTTYEVIDYELVIKGICPKCQSKGKR